MKSKTLLLSGLLVLGAAAGIATYAVSQSSPGYATRAEGDDPAAEEPQPELADLPILSTTPALNAEVPSTEPVSKIFVNTKAPGDDFVSIDRTIASSIEVTKDGQPYTTIDLTSKDSFYSDANWPGGVNLVPAKALSEPGVYSLTLPKGLVYIRAVDAEKEKEFLYQTPEYTLTFKVVYAIPYEMNPAGGDVVESQLQNVTFTYPEGATIAIKKGTAQLMYHDIAPGVDEQGESLPTEQVLATYTVTAKDNVVSLTTDVAVPTISKDIIKAYDYIKLTGGLWEVTYNGKTTANAAGNYGTFKVIAYNASLIQTNPAAGTVDAIAADKFETLRLRYPGDMKWVGGSWSVTLKSSNPNGASANTLLSYEFDSDNGNGTLTFKLKSSSKPVSALVTGKDNYYLEIPANTLQFAGTSKNSAIKIQGFNIKGNDYLPITSTYDNTVRTSMQSVSFAFNFNAVFADKDKEVIVKKDGVEVNRVKISTLTLPNLSNGKGVSSATIKCLATADKGTGIYEVTIPAGSFAWANNAGLVNQEYTCKIYLNPENPAFTTVPTQFDPENIDATLVDEINTIEIIYPEGTKLTPIVEKPTINFGTLLIKNWTNASSSISNFNITPTRQPLEYQNNKIIFKTSTVKQAVNDGQIICLQIPEGTFLIEKDGVSVPNNKVRVGLRIKNVATPTPFLGGAKGVMPGTVVPLTTANAVPVADITGTSLKMAPTYIGLEFLQSLYVFPASKKNPDTGVAEKLPINLVDEKGEIVTTFNAAKVEDAKQWYWGLFLTAAQADKIPGGKHTYTIQIPKGAAQFGSSTATATTAVTNPNEISIPVTLEKPAPEMAFADAFAYGATPAEVNLDNCYGASQGMPFGMGAVVVKAAKGIELVKDSKETVKLYKGTELVKAITAEEGIALGGIGEAADEATMTNDVTFFFVSSPEDVTDVYKQDGDWKVEIPAGLFTVNGNPVAAGELEYTYTNKATTAWEYTLDPVSGTEIDGKMSTVKLTVTNANSVDYDTNPGKLVNPDGETVILKSSFPKVEGNSIIWTIEGSASKPIDWKNGTYTFTIAKNSIWVNMSSDTTAEGNFPEEDIVALYIIKNTGVGVAVIGVEAADSYTVYTLDGKAVLINGTAEQLVELENGFYIVNGKKAIVRK